MQQTLTLLAGDSKEGENKGRGWKTKERGKKVESKEEILLLTPQEQRATTPTEYSF